jgi:hypothetical protein
MYHKALYLYYQNPKWLNKAINARIVEIAHDRYISKLSGMLINKKLWVEPHCGFAVIPHCGFAVIPHCGFAVIPHCGFAVELPTDIL